MKFPFVRRPVSALNAALRDGVFAALLTSAVLAWRGRVELGSAASALNASSHVVHGEQALLRNAATLRFTLIGTSLRTASAMFWGAIFRVLRGYRSSPSAASAVLDAAAVSSAAALVDLQLVPPRLSPGFERRLSRKGLTLVYVALAAGLALSALLDEGRPHRPPR